MIIPVRTACPYQVHIGPGVLARLPEFAAESLRVALIYPSRQPQLADRVESLLASQQVLLLPVPDGESAKTADVLTHCWRTLAAAGFTRSDLVLGIGGGTTTDLAGFVAATWLRGIRYVSVPTSVLAMVDASVGGKTGINLSAGKNLVGAFYEPAAVFCDIELLAGLPDAEVRAGLSEVIKTGFIKDRQILQLARTEPTAFATPGSDVFTEAASRAIKVKAEVVAADLTERTSVGSDVGREALNYGHSLGHAIEAHANFELRHGEAISIGMCWIAEVSHRLLGLADDVAQAHRELLGGLGLPTSYEPTAFPALRELMSLDKKSRGSQLRLVGLSQLGAPQILLEPPEQVLADCYAALH